MTSLAPEASPKALLAQLMKAARLQSAYRTQDALAGAIGKERTTVGKMEAGDRVPALDVLEDTLSACGVTGLAKTAIEGVWRLAKYTEEDAPVKVWFGGYLPIEAAAHTIRTWHPVIVPGLLQTEAYARALFTATGMNPAQVEEQVELRMRRQEILARERPPDLTFVLWEPVLHHQIGTPQVMREQLAKLLEFPSWIVVQVVPGDIGGNAGLGGAITLADGQKGAVLLAEALIEDQVTTDPDLVLKASATFNAVRADALPRARSRDLILEASEQWNDT
jgi:DNA-binding XRE family transcriptional regulator